MTAVTTDLDPRKLVQAEREALQRPRPSAMWDERLYKSHGVTFSWAERGDDLVAESNYLTALQRIRDAAGDDADDDVIDATVSDWLVGSLRQIFVRIRDQGGQYTAAFRQTVGLALHVRDHVLIDEADHNAREADARDALVAEALWQAGTVFDLDTDAERYEVTTRTRTILDDAGLYTRSDEVDRDEVGQIYRRERDRYFTDHAADRARFYRAILRPADGHGWPGPGQLPLWHA